MLQERGAAVVEAVVKREPSAAGVGSIMKRGRSGGVAEGIMQGQTFGFKKQLDYLNLEGCSFFF